MAVANVGFIAAMSGLRVLLMDWDLEAPGLLYFFRGLTDHEGANEIRRAPGVLNLFWNWELAIAQAGSPTELERAMRPFKTGETFRACARPLVPSARLSGGGALDVIGAGTAVVSTPEPTSYADALSRFNWLAFFEERAGGVMIEGLRDWSRQNYDLILVDSRTGLADVAGICTMQLPDDVILCFVLNRQNMEGVAQVAAAIGNRRGKEVAVRVAPMRVSKERPTEEADARARAQREFRRAHLATDQIEADMTRLAIPAASNVPFYETLAPFVASDASLDPLTLAYLGMTQELLGRELPRIKIDSKWAEDVRRRLEPRFTTEEYLRSLEAADPDRAIEEIDRYLDGALVADPSLELDPAYVDALVKATFDLDLPVNDSEQDERSHKLVASKAVALLKQLYSLGEGDWRLQYVDALEEYGWRFSPDDELSLQVFPERDEILARGEQTLAILERRVRLRTRLARLALRERPMEALSKAREAENLLNQASMIAGSDNERLLVLLRMTIANIRMEALRESDPPSARRQAELVLEYAKQAENDSAARMMAAEAHLQLAKMPSPPLQPIAHLMAAVGASPRTIVSDVDEFEWATKTVLAQEPPGESAITFLEAIFRRPSPPRYIAYARTAEGAIRFAESARQLIAVIGDSDEARTGHVLGSLAEVAVRTLERLKRQFRHPRQPSKHDEQNAVIAAYGGLAEMLAAAGGPTSLVQRLFQEVLDFDPERSSTNP